jgi:hypothetical protein
MFSRSTRLPFGPGSPAALSAAFAELRSAVAPHADGADTETLTEVLWSALHGLVALQRSGRLRSGHEAARIDVLVGRLLP